MRIELVTIVILDRGCATRVIRYNEPRVKTFIILLYLNFYYPSKSPNCRHCTYPDRARAHLKIYPERYKFAVSPTRGVKRNTYIKTIV